MVKDDFKLNTEFHSACAKTNNGAARLCIRISICEKCQRKAGSVSCLKGGGHRRKSACHLYSAGRSEGGTNWLTSELGNNNNSQDVTAVARHTVQVLPLKDHP